MALVPVRPDSYSASPRTCLYQSVSYTPLPPRDRTVAAASPARGRHNGVKKPSPPLPTDKLSIHSAVRIAASWRGFRTRRELRNLRMLQAFQNKYIIKMQCFYRCVHAKLERRRREALRAQFRLQKATSYAERRLAELEQWLRWQHTEIDHACRVLQQVWRWYVENRDRLPSERAKYRPAAAPTDSAAPKDRKTEPSPPKRRQPEDVSRAHGRQVVPWVPPHDYYALSTVSEDYVMNHNARIRKQEYYKQHYQMQPFALQRREQNHHYIANADFDGCAEVIQRGWRTHNSAHKVSTKTISNEYYNKHAAVIQRAWRSANARVVYNRIMALSKDWIRQKTEDYHKLQLRGLASDLIWNHHTLERATQIIQRAWRFYSRKQGSKPPYGLLEGTRSPWRPRTKPEARPKPSEAKEESSKSTEAQQQQPAGPGPRSPEPFDRDREAAIEVMQHLQRRKQAQDEVAVKRLRSPTSGTLSPPNESLAP